VPEPHDKLRGSPWRPCTPGSRKGDHALNASNSDSRLLSSVQSPSFLGSEWGRKVSEIDECIKSHGRQKSHNLSYKKEPVMEMYADEALVGEPMLVTDLTLSDAKVMCENLRKDGCVGFMVNGRPSSWRIMKVFFMSKLEFEKKTRWFTFMFPAARLPNGQYENKTLSAIRGELADKLALRTMEKARGDIDVSGLRDEGRAGSMMARLGEAQRHVEAQRRELRGAERARLKELRAAKEKASPPATVDLDGLRAALQDAERACQVVFQQVCDDKGGRPKTAPA